MKLLIKSATLVHQPSSFHLQKVDLLIENGKIAAIDKQLDVEADKVFTKENLHVSLGWFDSSVCFGEPGLEENETLENGLKTAAKSGFTGINLNPKTIPVVDNSSLIKYLKSYDRNFGVNLYPIGSLTKNSDGKDLAELFDMHSAGSVSFTDYKKPVNNPNLLKIALQYAQNFGGLVQSFPQENAIARNGYVNEDFYSTQLGLKGIPDFAEELQLSRDLKILEYTGGKLHVPTISTKKSVELIQEAKEKGLNVSCSVAIHNLCFTDEKLQNFNTNYKVLPPLRTEEDRKALVEGLKNSVIDMVTTDHCPINIEEKKVEFENAAFGSIGLETAFGALLEHFSVEETVKLLTKGRKRFNIELPTIEIGEEAIFTLFSPETSKTITDEDLYSTSKNSLFLGEKLKGKVYGIFAHNQLTENE